MRSARGKFALSRVSTHEEGSAAAGDKQLVVQGDTLLAVAFFEGRQQGLDPDRTSPRGDGEPGAGEGRQAADLTVERDKLALQLAQLKNLTHRLSDGYLDVDLLDEQVRDVLGYVRADEIVIR